MNSATICNLAESISVHQLFSLKERVALVTGGAGRYGRQICRALAEAGARVLVASRDYQKCVNFAQELEEEGFQADAFEIDLVNERSVRDAAENIQTKWARLDICFNNAVDVKAGPLCEHSEEEWMRTVGANSTGLYRACRIFGELMSRRNTGSIVNIASIYGLVSPDFRIYENCHEITSPPSYGFVKAGMIQLTRYLAVLFAPKGVRVNCISPGGLFSESMPREFVTEYAQRVPLGQMAGPNDLKGAAVFLASDASSYITGQNLVVDGGYTAL